MSTNTTSTRTPKHAPNPVWAAIFVGLSTIIMTLDSTIVNVALPSIADYFNSPLSSAQWVINAYTLAFASLLLGVGAISDFWGRRPLFLAGHIVFMLSSLACAFASSTSGLVIFRGLQGFGAAMVFGTCIPLIADAYAKEDSARRNRAIGLSMTVSVAAMAFGPLVGGIILQTADDFLGRGVWPWLFLINVPLGLICIIGTLIAVPNTYKKLRAEGVTAQGKADYLTVLYTVIGLFAINYAILYGPQRGWGNWKTIVPFIVGIIVMAVMIWRQKHKGDEALLNLNMFKIPSYSTVIVLGFISKLMSFGLFSYIIYWLFGVGQRTPIQIGAIIMLVAVPMIVVAGMVGPLGKKIGANNVVAIGMGISAVGLIVGLAVNYTTNWTVLIPALLLLGIGGGFVTPFMMDIAVSVVPPQKSGVATGMANAAMPLGTATGVAVNGAILASHVNNGLDDNSIFASLPADKASIVRDMVSTGAADKVGGKVADVLPTDQAHALNDLAIHLCSQGTAIVFVVCGVVTFLTVFLSKWGIRESDRWQPDSATSDADAASSDTAGLQTNGD